MPGEDFGAAVRLVVDELPDLPHLPELPDRGTVADLTGRGVAVIGELGFDLQPAGWRLTDAAGCRPPPGAIAAGAGPRRARGGARRATSGQLKVQVAGPWTLASTIEKPRGDKVLSDLGARRELAQALAEGVRLHLADVQRRVPGASLVLQLDEPALPFVLAGQVPTASGFNRHRSVTPPMAQDSLEWVLARGRTTRPPWCTAAPPTCPSPCCAGPGPGESRSTSRCSARRPTRSWRRRSTRVPGCSSAWCRRRATRPRRPRRRSSAPCGCWTCSASTGKRCPTSWCSRRRAGWPVRAPSYAKGALGAVRAAAAELG